MPPSPGPYDRLINSARPASECLLKSVPGIPQLRSAPKLIQEEMYRSDPNVMPSAISVSVIRSIDLKKLR